MRMSGRLLALPPAPPCRITRSAQHVQSSRSSRDSVVSEHEPARRSLAVQCCVVRPCVPCPSHRILDGEATLSWLAAIRPAKCLVLATLGLSSRSSPTCGFPSPKSLVFLLSSRGECGTESAAALSWHQSTCRASIADSLSSDSGNPTASVRHSCRSPLLSRCVAPNGIQFQMSVPRRDEFNDAASIILTGKTPLD